jgi:hypothetical protein
VKTLTVVGSQGTIEMPGTSVRERLGVQSTWFTVGVLSLSTPATTVVYGSRAQLTGIARGLDGATLQQLDGTVWKSLGTV